MRRGKLHSSFLILALAASVPSASLAAGSIAVTGDRPGLGNTVHAMAYDGNLKSYFQPSYNDWQYVQIDFGCLVTFSGIRRFMSRDGKQDIAGHRGTQGEGVSVSRDGVTWTKLTDATTTGWSNLYVNFAPHAWHTVQYGRIAAR
jgi:hypothetical protein